MAHPLFRLVAARPQLLAEHVAAYADLLTEELGSAAKLCQRRLAFQLVAVVGVAVGTGLGGVGWMLWAALPANSLREPWLLVAIPAIPWAIAAWAASMSTAVAPGQWLASVRRQWADDAEMLRRADQTTP
jgi:hypothetical protein